MKFKKGTKVEVLTLNEGSSGSWRCADVIGSNTRHYNVRYDEDVDLFGKATIEKVSQKAVRPYPPPTVLIGGWVPGDVAEVFHNYSWKMATILEVSGHNNVFVRLCGSRIEFKASVYDVRVRLCWQNGGWIVVGEASNKWEDLRSNIPSSPKNYHQQREHLKCDNKLTKNAKRVQESQAMRSKPVKRKRSQLPEKVENIASSREVMHEKYSLIENINGWSEMNMKRDQTDDVSVSSSVASCSSVYRNSSHKVHRYFTKDNESDAESCCYLRSEEGDSELPTKERLIEEIHRIELDAYRCTIGALYESGPLSWEQELLLTNLRESLYISNDEHLVEIRSLVSSSN